jgi:hypothetical protein
VAREKCGSKWEEHPADDERAEIPGAYADAARTEKSAQAPAIRNTFGIGTEGVSAVFNIFSPAIRNSERGAAVKVGQIVPIRKCFLF